MKFASTGKDVPTTAGVHALLPGTDGVAVVVPGVTPMKKTELLVVVSVVVPVVGLDDVPNTKAASLGAEIETPKPLVVAMSKRTNTDPFAGSYVEPTSVA